MGELAGQVRRLLLDNEILQSRPGMYRGLENFWMHRRLLEHQLILGRFLLHLLVVKAEDVS
jgi:hypothetical protein